MRRVLIANRGEIAVRIARACFDEGLECVVAASSADAGSLAARMADDKVVIGPPPAKDSYLQVERIIAAALTKGCDTVHPGYGFLSERAELADACAEAGLTFVGPPGDVMRRSGDKLRAREVAASLGIPTGGGTPALASLDEAIARAEEINAYPLILKASAGGGGRGMTIVRGVDDLRRSFEVSRNEALQAFGDGTVYLERYIEKARHVEVQILADTHGNVIHLGERDCSVQRRHQKLIEEAPAALLPSGVAEGVRDAAVRLCRELSYVGAGTVEFLVDIDRGDFIFLELNARVQVEHPVTEMITGIDIVRMQLRIAAGEVLPVRQESVMISGHSLECRINAEDPRLDFRPNPGQIDEWVPPLGEGVRVDTYVQPGVSIPPFYDSMVAKVIVHDVTREAALQKMSRALSHLRVSGITTTKDLHAAIIANPDFAASPTSTRWLESSFLTTWLAEEVRSP